YPNVWIRIQRSGTTISEYYGSDGINWTAHGTIDLSSDLPGFPAEVYVGVFSDPEDTNGTQGHYITYKDFGNIIVIPTISISQVGGQVTLSWPAASEGFTLQSRSSLASGNWVNVS